MPEYLSLDPTGVLAPEGDAGQRYVSSRTGRWRIVPSADDLVLLRREQVGGEAGGVRAVLTGDLGGFGLGELVAFLAQSRWTGVLTVAHGAVEKTIFIKQGSVRWAASNLPADRLGEAVRRLGLVTSGELQRILEDPQAAGLKLGQLLLGSNLITPADLYKAIKHQIEEIFFSVLVMERGLYFLFNDPVEGRFAAQVSLDLNGLLMDGLRRVDELGHFRKVIPGAHAWVSRRGRVPDGLNEQERAVWDAVDGRRTVREVAVAAHLPEFDTTKALFGLAETGCVEVSTEKPQAVLGRNVEQLKAEVHEIVRVFNTIYREIYDEVGRIAPTAGFRLGTDGFLASDHHGFPDVFRGLAVDEEGMLPEERLLANLAAIDRSLVPDLARHVFDALNELMFFELFQAGELLPQDRDEDLSRRVKLIYELLEQ